MSAIGIVSAAAQLGLESIIIKPKRGIYNIVSGTDTFLDIVAQATIRETHIDELEVTDHPVQQGASISDHAFKLPAEVTIEIGWSGSPSESNGLINSALATAAANSPTINAINNVYQQAQAAISTISGIQSMINGNAITPQQDTLNWMYSRLLQLQSARALFDIYTGRRVYNSMVCKSLAVETDYKTSEALFVKMVCKQVILVNVQTVILPVSQQKTPQDTASQADSGTKQLIQKLNTP